jgi:deoxyribodipyrimidine photo-lyase
VWMRRDLRLADQRALSEATHQSEEVLVVFVIDENITKYLESEDTRITFIQDCLDEVNDGLKKHGSKLLVVKGEPTDCIPELAQKFKVNAVFTNEDYEPYAKKRDEEVKKSLARENIQFFSFMDQVVFEKREILNGSNEPYKVFTPYSKKWLASLAKEKTERLKDYKPNLKRVMAATSIKQKSDSFFDHGFKRVPVSIEAGEKAGKKFLREFAGSIDDYGKARDYPAIAGTSKLSTHFRFGTISIREAVRFCDQHLSPGTKIWLSELIWREFYHMILDQFPHVAKESFRAQYRDLKWEGKKEHFKAWCEGRTGYPIVDAAMRQLNETGWMHNRLRMVTAMFLTKDLLIDWREGEHYFAKLLLDYDLAANNGGWQWSASTGCDAQPYFRIMNPISQSERFDEDGEFIRKFVPELAKVSNKYIHWPHDQAASDAPKYPKPVVEHKVQRQKALKLFKDAKKV